MNLSDITAKAWILALFIRDDGQRFLLGDGWYDFKDSLQHFQPDNIANDVVELQGADGQLLAGQVRRSGTQEFSGYVGDATTSRATIETRRRDFLGFFQVRRKYKVVYIFPDGKAIQRQRGYLVEPPTVKETWQIFPEYHVALSFENVPYYEYNENSSGQEIYSHTVQLTALNYVTPTATANYSLTGISRAYPEIEYAQPVGDSAQAGSPTPTSPIPVRIATGWQTVTMSDADGIGAMTPEYNLGKNILPFLNTEQTINGVTFTPTSDGGIRVSGTASAMTSYPINADGTTLVRDVQLQPGTYTMSCVNATANVFAQAYYLSAGSTLYATGTFTSADSVTLGAYIRVNNGTAITTPITVYPMLESGGTATAFKPYFEPVELAKVGNAVDYIYPNGNTLRKETGKVVLNGSETGWNYNSTNKVFWIRYGDAGLRGYTNSSTGYCEKMCDYFTYHAQSGNDPSLADGLYENSSTSNTSMLLFHHSASTSLGAFQTWLSDHPITIYYVAGSAQITTLTNATLVSQIANLKNRVMYENTNITITANGNNLPASLRLSYATTANEKTISMSTAIPTYPVWKINGPATAPLTLKNGTTGKSITFNRSVASGYQLVVDIGAQTALANGVNVISDISGDWVSISNGDVVAYRTGSNTGVSTLEWNGVVG